VTRAALRRVALLGARGPLRPLAVAAHRAVIAIVAQLLGRVVPGTAVYVRGSFGGAGDPIPGLSDVDLVLVVPDGPGPPGTTRRAPVERWARATRRLGMLRALVVVGAYEDRELEDVVRANVLTHPRALFAGDDPLRDHLTARCRPGVPAPMADWRRVAGPDRRPRTGPPADERWAGAWLDLQVWWRYAFWASERPRDDPYTSYLGAKLVAEPLRSLLWLRHGEPVVARREALERGLRALPAEEPAIRAALAFLDRLAPFDLHDSLAALLRLTREVAAEVAAAAEAREGAEVRLVRADGGEGGASVPLVDWRARSIPGGTRERLFVVGGARADDPRALVAAGARERPGHVPAIDAGGVLVLPTLDRTSRPLRGLLRAVQCPQSDPVTFALLAGRDTALFPGLPGWSARDCARRAADETGDTHFLASLERGDPELAC
jgi:hypothetical protein